MWTSTRFIRRIWPGSENLLEQRKAPTIAGYLGRLDGMRAWDSLGCLALMLLWRFSLSVVLRASLLSIFMFSLWWLRASAFTSLALGHYHSHCSHTFHNHLSEVVVKDQTALLSLSCLLYSFWSERPVFCHSWGSIAGFFAAVVQCNMRQREFVQVELSDPQTFRVWMNELFSPWKCMGIICWDPWKCSNWAKSWNGLYESLLYWIIWSLVGTTLGIWKYSWLPLIRNPQGHKGTV